MTELWKERFEAWQRGATFEELAQKYGIGVKALISHIIQELRWGNYSITDNPKASGSFGTVCIIREVNNILKDYAYVDEESPCYSLWSPGIYNHYEDVLRKASWCLLNNSFNVIEKDRYRVVKRIYTSEYARIPYPYYDVANEVEARLNRLPDFYNVLSVSFMGEKEVKQVYYTASLPLLTTETVF